MTGGLAGVLGDGDNTGCFLGLPTLRFLNLKAGAVGRHTEAKLMLRKEGLLTEVCSDIIIASANFKVHVGSNYVGAI